MRYAIRALGWATIALWILIISFSATVVYSAMQIGLNFGGTPEFSASNSELTVSIPFSISNGGLYDISQLNITTCIIAENETALSSSTSLVPLIPKKSTVNESYSISLSLEDLVAKNLTYMLFNDTNLNVDMFVGLTYAYAIPLKIASNQTMPWGAPFHNLTVAGISVAPPNQVGVSLSFDNHAFFSINGTVRLEIFDASDNQIGSGTSNIFVAAGDRYGDILPVMMTGDPYAVAKVHLYFDSSLFSFGPVVIDIAV